MSRGLAFFDFDGTITFKDTLLEFIRFSRGSVAFYSGFALHAPWLMLMKLGVLPNQKVKERVLAHFFKGMPEDEMSVHCRRFIEQKLPQLLRPKALAEIELLRSKGIEVVIVSASPENWIAGWAQPRGIRLISSKLEVAANRITGNLVGINCHGEEKVRRIRAEYSISDLSGIYAYGDSEADKPMLALAEHAFFKPFR